MVGQILETQHFSRGVVSIKLVLKKFTRVTNEKAGCHTLGIRTNENTWVHQGEITKICILVRMQWGDSI